MAENTIANRTLFIADNLDVLRGMNSATVDLIYLDPPFNSGRAYRAPVGSVAAGAAFKDAWTLDDVKEEWVDEIEERNPALHYAIRAAGFSSGSAMQGYLTYMAVRLIEMRRVLKPDGSVYLHCDDTASHHLKVVMDSVFGAAQFRNEIIWQRYGSHNDARKYGRVGDRLLFYASPSAVWNTQYQPLGAVVVEQNYRQQDERGRFATSPLHARTLTGGGYEFTWRGIKDIWKFPMHRLEELDADGRIYWPPRGSTPRRKVYLDEAKGKPLADIMTDISIASGKERTGYPTQKPIALLERIIAASSNKGDVVLDPFCGCATTCVAAEKLGREWIGIDLSEKAYDLVVERLAKEVQVSSDDLQGAKRPFSGFVGNVTRRMDAPKRTDLPSAPAGARRSPNIRAALYAAQEGKCNGCEWRVPIHTLTIDHIHPRSEEGPDIDANLQLLCSSCNSVKNARIMTLEQLREATKARGTHVSLSEGE